MNSDLDHISGLYFVLGGIASGKSLHAEGLASAMDLPKTYLATAQNRDGEMAEKIARHRDRRGSDWTLVEAPLDVISPITSATGVVLFDCATLWLSNLLEAGEDVETATSAMLDAVAASPAHVVIVSNELGLGGIGADPMTRAFQRAQGAMNQKIAARAQRVDLVTAGIPQRIKG